MMVNVYIDLTVDRGSYRNDHFDIIHSLGLMYVSYDIIRQNNLEEYETHGDVIGLDIVFENQKDAVMFRLAYDD